MSHSTDELAGIPDPMQGEVAAATPPEIIGLCETGTDTAAQTSVVEKTTQIDRGELGMEDKAMSKIDIMLFVGMYTCLAAYLYSCFLGMPLEGVLQLVFYFGLGLGLTKGK